MEQEKKTREQSFLRELVPDRRPTREQVLWTIRIAIVLVAVLGILTLIGLTFSITLWEWLKLLIVPAVIAAGGLWFNRQQRDRELEVADRRAQDEALQAYLDQMGQMLTDKDKPLHQSKEDDEVQTLARARTLTVLRRLDGERKASVLQFLYESGLIAKGRPVLHLTGAGLSEAVLTGANLSKADLSGARLFKAYLIWADLGGTNLSEADLSEADLTMANLSEADLSEADLRGAKLFVTNIRAAVVPGGDKWRWRSIAMGDEAAVIEAFNRGGNLIGADLSGADLSGIKGTTNHLVEAEVSSLVGATMPDGQKYEDWLKSRKGEGE